MAGSGAWVGQTPWRVFDRHQNFGPCVDVRDVHGNLLDFTLPRIAKTAAAAVNERNKLFGDNVVYRDALAALFQQIYAMAPSHGRTRALELIEGTLHPDKGLEKQEATPRTMA
jgi:hypothetical protein